MDYSKAQIDEAWNKATIDENNDPKIWRKDPCGAWINYNQYGKQSEYGWSIDHIIPKVLFNNNDYDSSSCNRRAMHWENNLKKSDDFPEYKCIIMSENVHNIRKENTKHINEQTITSLLKEVSGLDSYIQKHKNEWISIYGKEKVEQWIRKKL